MEFGWDGDGGVGEMLVRQIIDGSKTATCAFSVTYSDEELAEAMTGAGELYAVLDNDGKRRATIKVTDVFLCSFGDPDPRLVAGEGDGDDTAKFRDDHRIAWAATVPGIELTDDQLLVVEIFELAEEARP